MRDPAAARETGWHSFDLVWRPGSSVGIEVCLRRDDVSVWMDGRTLAVIDRDRFRDWLLHPDGPLVRDDLVWSVEAGVTCLSIGVSRSFAVPADTVRYLRAVI